MVSESTLFRQQLRRGSDVNPDTQSLFVQPEDQNIDIGPGPQTPDNPPQSNGNLPIGPQAPVQAAQTRIQSQQADRKQVQLSRAQMDRNRQIGRQRRAKAAALESRLPDIQTPEDLPPTPKTKKTKSITLGDVGKIFGGNLLETLGQFSPTQQLANIAGISVEEAADNIRQALFGDPVTDIAPVDREAQLRQLEKTSPGRVTPELRKRLLEADKRPRPTKEDQIAAMNTLIGMGLEGLGDFGLLKVLGGASKAVSALRAQGFTVDKELFSGSIRSQLGALGGDQEKLARNLEKLAGRNQQIRTIQTGKKIQADPAKQRVKTELASTEMQREFDDLLKDLGFTKKQYDVSPKSVQEKFNNAVLRMSAERDVAVTKMEDAMEVARKKVLDDMGIDERSGIPNPPSSEEVAFMIDEGFEAIDPGKSIVDQERVLKEISDNPEKYFTPEELPLIDRVFKERTIDPVPTTKRLIPKALGLKKETGIIRRRVKEVSFRDDPSTINRVRARQKRIDKFEGIKGGEGEESALVQELLDPQELDVVGENPSPEITIGGQSSPQLKGTSVETETRAVPIERKGGPTKKRRKFSKQRLIENLEKEHIDSFGSITQQEKQRIRRFVERSEAERIKRQSK